MPPLKTIPQSQAGMKNAILVPVRLGGRIVKNHFLGPVKKLAANFDWADGVLRYTEKTLKDTPASDELALYGRKSRYDSIKIHSYHKPISTLDSCLDIVEEWLTHHGCLSRSKQ